MKERSWILEAAFSALAAVILVLLSGLSLQKAFDRQKRQAFERLEKPMVVLIEHAYHLKDDLAIQQAATALGQAPGIYFACVIGPDGKIMAHSQPMNVGQPYHRASSPIVSHPLIEGQKRWGTFVFSASDKALRSAWLREITLCSLGAVFLWLAWMARSLVWRRRLAEFEHRIADLSTLAEEQKQKELREAERQVQARVLWTAWLQSAVDKLPDGAMILDQRQRVAAANTSVAPGTPWSEVPLLKACGTALEQSLHSPCIEVKVEIPSDGTVLAFTTLKNGMGTWVTLFPSKVVVK